NVGKSFFALDLAYHVALGWKWRGLDVDRGAVVYIAGEGAGGICQRIEAFCEEHGVEKTAGAPLAIVPAAINFPDEKEIAGLIELVRDVAEQAGIPVRWVIVDTLSRALAGGNENAPDDMGALVRGVDRVRTEIGCHVTLIHHSGKDDAKGARGHSLLRAAIDTEIKIERQDGGGAVAHVTKQRDLECGPPMSFKLRTVALGENARGKSITSCVVEAMAPPQPRLTDAEQEAVDLLTTLIFESDKTRVHIADWRTAIMSAKNITNILPGKTTNVRQTQWQRLRDKLKTRGIIKIYGENVELRQTPQTWAVNSRVVCKGTQQTPQTTP